MAKQKPLDKISDALALQKETRSVDFKQDFDPQETRDWCRLLKDVLAIANSDGGIILFGLDNNGAPAGTDVSAISNLDPATFTDKLASYTGIHYEEFRLSNHIKGGQKVVCLEIFEAETPLIPTKAGTYPSTDRKTQDRAFSAGVIYVRHGAKSEPANTWDLRKIIEKRVSESRKDVLRGVHKIARAPSGSTVDVLIPNLTRTTSGNKVVRSIKTPDLNLTHAVRVTNKDSASPIRITASTDAPAFRLVKPDETHPFRMKELVRWVNKELASNNQKITPANVHDVNRVYRCFSNVEYCYESQHGPRQYSEAFARWLVEQIRKCSMFCYMTRGQARRMSYAKKRR